MNKKQVDTWCQKINDLDCAFSAEAEAVSKYMRGHPLCMKVIHKDSGNEVAFARSATEASYVFRQIASRLENRKKGA